MQNEGKVYGTPPPPISPPSLILQIIKGFTITLYEFEKTIKTLWSTVVDFIRKNPHYIAENSAAKFITDNNGDSYNLCHFWSNFEIADLDFWRG